MNFNRGGHLTNNSKLCPIHSNEYIIPTPDPVKRWGEWMLAMLGVEDIFKEFKSGNITEGKIKMFSKAVETAAKAAEVYRYELELKKRLEEKGQK